MSTSGILLQLRDCKIDAERRWSSCKVKNGNVHKIEDFREKPSREKKETVTNSIRCGIFINFYYFYMNMYLHVENFLLNLFTSDENVKSM